MGITILQENLILVIFQKDLLFTKNYSFKLNVFRIIAGYDYIQNLLNLIQSSFYITTKLR